MSSGPVLLQGFRVQLLMSGLSPLAVISSAVTPASYGIVVISGFGRPTAALLLGTIATGLWGTLQVQSAITVVQERSWGTLQNLAASPTPLAAPLVGRLLGAAVQGLLTIPVTLTVVLLVFGLPAGAPWPRFALAIPVTAVGLVGMALVLMGALARFRYAAGMINGLFGLVILLGGFFVPLAALPTALSVLGYALPPAWAIDAVARSADHPWRALGIGALVSLVWLGGGIRYLAGAERRLRRSASAYHH